jgi:hypothetical protein
VALIGEACGQGDIRQRHARLQQVDRGLLDSQVLNIFGDGLPLKLAKRS